MIVKIIPFKKEHAECMDIREHERFLISEDLLSNLEKGIAFTGIIDGRIISCWGINLGYFGNADIWQMPSIYVKDHTIVYGKYVRRWINDIRKQYALHRLETTCLDDELHNRWMKFLGFEQEGKKRKWINGQDYIMWARLWED